MVQQWETKVIMCWTMYINKNSKDIRDSLKGKEGEYTLASLNGLWTPLEECGNILGANGWELVGTTPLTDGSVVCKTFFLLFKRPKSGTSLA